MPVVGDGCPVVWLLKKVLPAKIHFLTFDLLFLLLTCFALLGFCDDFFIFFLERKGSSNTFFFSCDFSGFAKGD